MVPVIYTARTAKIPFIYTQKKLCLNKILSKIVIKIKTRCQAPFFIYYDDQGRQHRVWFEDARSTLAKLDLYSEYGFEGVGYWNIMRYFPQNWLIVSNLYDIAKIL